MRRPLAALVAALALLACDQIKPDTGSSAEADGGAGATGADASTSCRGGFRDITGRCATDLTCLETTECDPASADVCSEGVNGKGVCFGTRCMYVNDHLGCSDPADCPCGICGADSHCYEDRLGTCGGCGTTGNPGNGTGACKACLDSCQGTISCCAGAGCICEGQCEGFI